MIKVYVKKQSNHAVETPELKKTVQEFLKNQGIVSDSIVEVAIVGEKKMIQLAQTYLGEKNVVHNVLSFPTTETKEQFVTPPDGFIHLGEVVVCYSKVVEEANKEGKLVNQKIIELVEHGCLHLLGIHHK